MATDVGSAVGYLDLDISGFLSGLRSAQSEADETSKNIATKIGNNMQSAGKNLTSAGSTLTKGITVPLAAAGTAAIKTTSDFESAMSQVQATMGIAKDSTSELKGKVVNTNDALSDLAQTMGKETKFSASEAADAINILAMAGYDTEKIYGTLPNILNLAAAGGMGIADAADIATGVMAGFNYEADRSAEVSDKIAMLASSAKGSVQEFGVGMSIVSGQARVTGQEFDDVAVALGILGNNNLAAAEGGNALNRVLKNLYQPTDTAKTALEGLGISAYDAQGNAKALPEVLQNLQDKLAPLTKEEYNDVMSQIFDAATMKSAPFLIDGVTEAWNLQGDSADSLIDKIQGAGDAYDGIGAAAGQAETQMDNLSGQFTILKSALEGVAIQLGNILMPYIKKFVDKIQELVDWFANLSTEQQEQVVKFAAIAAAIGPVLLTFGKLITSVGNIFTTFDKIPGAITKVKGAFTSLGTKLINVKEGFILAKSGMTALGGQASPLGAALAGITAPIAAIIAAVAALVAAFVTLWKTNEEFRNKMTAIWNQIKETVDGFCNGIVERINALGFNFKDITEMLWAIWKGFCDLLAPIFEGVFQGIAIIIETVLGVITGILDVFIGLFTGNWDQLWTGVKEVFGSIWNGLVEFFKNIVNTLKGVLDAICGWFGTTWDDTWNAIKQFFVDTWNAIVNFFVNIGTTMETAVSNFITAIINFFAQLPTNIANFITNAFNAVVTWASNMVAKASEMGTNFINNVVSFFAQLPGKVLQFITSALQNVQTWATNMATQAITMGTNFINNVVSFLTQLPGKVKGFLDSAIENVKTWITQMGQKGKEAIESLISNVVEAATAIPGKMAEIGNNIVQGVWNGIKNAASWFTDQVKGFFSGIVDGVKDALGIGSPSKVMADQVGKWMPAGVAIGFEKAMPAAMRNIQTALNKGIDSVEADDIKIRADASVTSFADKVKSIYENVAVWFESIDARLAKSVDGMIQSLNMLINAGQVIVNSDGTLGYVGYNGFTPPVTPQPVDSTGRRNDSSDDGDTYNFYSPKAIDEIEAAKQMKKTKRDIAEGF